MKILHIIFSFAPDGAETMLVDIINAQSKSDDIELIIINDLYNLELISTINSKTKIHFLNRKEGSVNPFKIARLNLIILNIKPDIIHFHNHNAIGLLLFKKIAKTCLTIHSVNKPIKYFSRYDKLFSISDAVQKDISKRGGFNSKVIYNGIDFSKIKSKQNFETNARFRIVVVGRLFHKVKGQDVLLNALHILLYDWDMTNINVDFIGEGPSLNYLEELAQQLKIKDFVNFLGLKSRKYIYNNLHDYSLLVQPSIYEGFGLTVVEGMAAKVPVLASNSDGPKEIICNGKYGFLFKKGDAFDCARVIKNIIENRNSTPDLNVVYEYANLNFSIQNTAKEYLNGYQILL